MVGENFIQKKTEIPLIENGFIGH